MRSSLFQMNNLAEKVYFSRNIFFSLYSTNYIVYHLLNRQLWAKILYILTKNFKAEKVYFFRKQIESFLKVRGEPYEDSA